MRRTELPSELQGKPLTAARLTERGIYRNRLLRSDLVPLGSGVYAPRHLADAAGDEALYRLRALGVAGDFPHGWLSHLTAARIFDCPLPARLHTSEVHLSHSHQSGFRVRRRGVVGHRSETGPEELVVLHGARLTSAARTWCDLAVFCSVEELVIAGDHLVRVPNRRFEGRSASYSSLEKLRAAVQARRGFRGRPRAVAALEQIRVGADSAPETTLRLRLVASGLPEPMLQVPVSDRAPKGHRTDIGYPQWKIAIQYDGEVHFTPQRARQDQRRDNAFLAQGWIVLRFNREDLRDGFRVAVQQVAAAIRLREQG